MTSGRLLILLLASVLSFCRATEAIEERFYEQLVLRPNHDGTVTSSFAFTTLLKGGQPRNPRKLGQEDDCKCIVYLPTRSYSLNEAFVSAALHPIPTCAGPNSS